MPRSPAIAADWRAPLRAVVGRLRPGDGYRRFVHEVEPRLIARPRVHRFGVPALLGDAATPAAPLAVCLAPGPGGDAEATRASLHAQTVAPGQVLESAPEQALADTRAQHVVLLEAGDRLAPTALERLGQAVTLAPEARVITCDDDVMDAAGRRRSPRLAPGPSPDAALAGVQAGPPVVVAREPALAIRPQTPEFALALAGADSSGHAHVPQVLVHRRPREPGDPAALADSVQCLLARCGDASARVELTDGGLRRVRRQVLGEPSVEVIVCFRDRPELLERCARSVLERSTYERLSMRLVDNASSDPAVSELLAGLQRDRRVQAHRDESPFNFAALNNRAASASSADFLVFLNNDTDVITATWIEELLEEAQREEVGAVAPLLTYPDGRVQHAGAAIGLHGYAGHPFAGLMPTQSTAFGTAAGGTRNWLAVTAACLMLERRKLEAAGGFDESFAVGGNDVELCLRLTAAGHRSLCVPHVLVVHDESSSRDPLDLPAGDLERSRQAYGEYRTAGDPFYNPNLTLAATDCSLRRARELAS